MWAKLALLWRIIGDYEALKAWWRGFRPSLPTPPPDRAYFIYDPDYKHLNLGVVGALVEMEYMRMVRQKFNSRLTYYHLGELTIGCPKVNYKLNYQPGGLVLCPYSKRWLPIAEALPQMEILSEMTMKDKKLLQCLRLDE